MRGSTPAIAALVLAAAVSLASPATTARTWPASRARTLSGKPLTVPEQLGTTNVLIVGFTKRSRTQTEAWSRRLRGDARVTAKASVYDVMVLDGVPSLIRSTILRQVTSGVPKDRHERFLVVTEDVSTWRTFLNVHSEDVAYIVVLSSRGEVKWRSQGALNETYYQALGTALQ